MVRTGGDLPRKVECFFCGSVKRAPDGERAPITTTDGEHIQEWACYECLPDDYVPEGAYSYGDNSDATDTSTL